MPTVSTETVRSGGVTLVETSVTASDPHRVRLAVHCDGPVWPPRDDPAGATWQSGTVTLELAGGTTGVGFATTAPPGSVRIDLVDAEPVQGDLPAGIDAWLEAVEERVAAAERVADADDLAAAAAVVASVGDLESVERLAADLARDRRLLARFSFAPTALCERAAAVELPVGSLATVAQSRSS